MVHSCVYNDDSDCDDEVYDNDVEHNNNEGVWGLKSILCWTNNGQGNWDWEPGNEGMEERKNRRQEEEGRWKRADGHGRKKEADVQAETEADRHI